LLRKGYWQRQHFNLGSDKLRVVILSATTEQSQQPVKVNDRYNLANPPIDSLISINLTLYEVS
jgi:hypothetical protein